MINDVSTNKLSISPWLCPKNVKPQQIHGINVVLINSKNGDVIELPRFISVEMQQAQKMNKLALDRIKAPIYRKFSKAEPSDYIRLTSPKVKDSYNRAEWTNLKDGKVYNILKEFKLADGKIRVKILDKDGGFIKYANLTPSNIVILDVDCMALPRKKVDIMYGAGKYEISKLTHKQAVEIYAKRHNPFANYEIMDYNGKLSGEFFYENDSDKHLAALENLYSDISNGKKVDYLICSWGHNVDHDGFGLDLSAAKKISKILDKIAKYGVRVIMASSNSIGGTKDNAELMFTNYVEGVGSLNHFGKISDFSSSRNSELTQHYELGEHPIINTSCGLNITGLRGTDIEYEVIHPYKGLNPEIRGTSYACPIRAAKLALNDMMQNVIN